MSLESSFRRDLLYTAAWFQKKQGDTHYTDFYIWRNSTNDIGDCLHYFPDIPYDVFYIATCQRRYATYCRGNMGRNHVTGKMAAA